MALSRLNLYSTLLKYIITKGDREPEFTVPDNAVRYGISTLYSANYLHKYIFIQAFPTEVDSDFKAEVRRIVQEVPETRVAFIDVVEPFDLRKNERLIKHRLSTWADRYDAYTTKMNNMSTGEKLKKSEFFGSKDLSDSHMIRSFEYIQQSIAEHRAFCQVKMIIKITATKRENLVLATKAVESALFYNDVKLYRVLGYLKEFLHGFGVGALSYRGTIVGDCTNDFIIDDKLLTTFDTYSQGYIPCTGFYIGNDYFTGIPTYRSMDRGTDRCFSLIAADAGSGKSLLLRELVEQALLNKEKVLLIDYEGDEYIRYAKFLDATILGFSHGTYYDTVEIGDLTGDPEEDALLKDSAINYTMRVMGLLVRMEGLNAEEIAVFNDIMNALYIGANVVDDNTTWVNSKGLEYRDVFNIAKSLQRDKEYYALHTQALDTLINAWRAYFGEDALFAKKFSKKISINQLRSANFIVFLFGERGAVSTVISDVDTALKQTYVATISQQLTNYWYFKQGINTHKFYEEGQRYLKVAGASAIIHNDWTGGRKRGLRGYLITNQPSMIFDSTDEYMAGIDTNFSDFFIGRLGSKDAIATLSRRFNLEPSRQLLEDMGNQTDESLKYHFLSGTMGDITTLTAVKLPQWLLEDRMFKTGGAREADEL